MNKGMLVVCVVVALVGATATEGAEMFGKRDVPLRNWRVAKAQAIGPDAAISPASEFVAVEPCRLLDTREQDDPYFGQLQPGVPVTIDVDGGPCGIPAEATAYSMNFTSTQQDAQGNVRAYPTGTVAPLVSTVNYRVGINVANAAIVPAGTDGGIDVMVSFGATHLVIDVNGYFVEAGSAPPPPPAGNLAAGVVTVSARCSFRGPNDAVSITGIAGSTSATAIITVTRNGGLSSEVVSLETKDVAVSFVAPPQGGAGSCEAGRWVIHTVGGGPIGLGSRFSVTIVGASPAP